MATAPEENKRESYEGGGGGYGKFPKRPFRRHNGTPYDRPPTAIRNPSSSNSNVGGSNHGWLSRLVDPAQRLIASSAHRLFGSVFRKRLPQPPAPDPLPMEPEANQETRDRDHGTIFSDHSNAPDGDINGCDYPSNSLEKDGVIELEQILKQRTFTRSEIDRLTGLLRSRTVGENEKRSEVGPSNLDVPHGKKVEFPSTPANGNRIESNLIGTPVVNSSVLDEDIASPAEVAKAYMDRKPSKASPSMLSWQNERLRDDSSASLNRTLPTKAPITSLVSRSSTHAGVHENGFVTPRSRGRSAIYNMARTPYSRVHSTAAFKDVGFSVASSSSQGARDQSMASGSKQRALKRRSSVLDYDIGSIGPIRRIRQKPSLLSSKNLGMPAAGSTLSIRETNVGSQAAQSSSLVQNLLPADKTNQSFKKKLSGSEDNRVPDSSFTTIPSKSSEMASKILEQLDVLVTSRDKSPTKLSPSMLRGPALRSLENVDSSKFLENVDGKKLVGLHDTSLPGAGECIRQKGKVEENGPSNVIAPSDKFDAIMNGNGTKGLIKGNVPSVKSAVSALNRVVHPQPQKKQAFRMSAHEDYLDLDEDDHPNGAGSSATAHGREKSIISVAESRTIRAEALTTEKPPIDSGGKPFTASVSNENTEKGFSNGTVVAEMPAFPAAPLSNMTGQAALGSPQSTVASVETALLKESKCVDSLHDIGDKVPSVKEPNASSSLFMNGSAFPSVVSGSAGLTFNVSPDARSESSSSFAFVAAGVSDSWPKVSDLEKADDDSSTSKRGVSFRARETSLPSAASTSSSTAGIVSVSNPANGGGLNNGSVTFTPSFTSHIQSSVSDNVASQSLSPSFTPSFGGWASAAETTTAATAGSLFTSATASPSISSSIFKFGSSTVASSTSVSVVSSTAGLELVDAKTKGTNFGSSAGASVGTSATTSSTGNGIFGGSSAVMTSSGGNIFGGSSAAITSSGSSIFGSSSAAITSTAGTTFGGSSLAISSTGSGIFGLSSPAMSSTGSTIFGFSSPATTSNIFGASSFASTNQSGGSTPSTIDGAMASAGGTGIMTSTQSMPSQFSSSASSPSIQLSGNSNFSSGASLFGSSSGANPFSSGASFGMNPPTMLSGTNSLSTSSSTASSLFGSNWQVPKSSNFGTTFSTASASSTGFAFGGSSTTSASMGFGTSAGSSSGSIFPFTSAGAASVPAPPSQPVFGNSNTGFAFGSSPVVNNDQMTMEDSMAEDTVQATSTAVPIFGQQTVTPSSSPFMFGSAAPAGANPFQFGSQQNLAAPQNNSPFQASGSLDFNAGGSFSLGAGGDKSNRRTVKVSRSKNRKK
ncbi:nuclear pore complex protein NUP1-like isoform X2 [Tripterygium wilfordii]|uniref:nuclear pore complex protein NUP1-like isoform X2 n=1 Tax=Tripterygium wilfordii TaxID=458696 RepID=UPI0018F80A3F|nr:nuclear pore complex protein NUP1-like isoform X2 [Tripterygium wilfordii]